MGNSCECSYNCRNNIGEVNLFNFDVRKICGDAEVTEKDNVNLLHRANSALMNETDELPH